MLNTEMSRGGYRDMLAQRGTGRLACSRENQPYDVPVYTALLSRLLSSE